MSDVKNSSLATGLVSYWELEEVSNGSAPVTRIDSHGSNDLTDNNTVGSATGIQGNGADMEKDNNEYLSITDASQTGLGITNNISISAWVKLESNSSVMTIAGKWASSNLSFLFYIAGNELIWRSGDSGSNNAEADGAFTWSLGTWYHVAVTYSSGAVTLYVNGADITVDGTGLGTSIYNGTAPFIIGSNANNPTGEDFDGVIDEVGVWSRVLSASDVTALYNGGAGIPYDAGTPTPTDNALFMCNF